MNDHRERGPIMMQLAFLLPWLVAFHAHSAAAQAVNSVEEVVRAEVRASNDGDLDRLMTLFTPEALIFDLPDSPDRLAGRLAPQGGTGEQRRAMWPAMLARSPRPRAEILDTLTVGDLAAVKLRIDDAPGFSAANIVLFLYRIRDGRILDLWQSARTSTPAANEENQAVIRKFVAANNAGDTEVFLGFFSPGYKYFRGSDDTHGLADQMSARMSEAESRRTIITTVFAKGSPGQVQIVDILSLGDLVASHDRVTLPTGAIVNQMKIYRVQNGLITHDWTAYER